MWFLTVGNSQILMLSSLEGLIWVWIQKWLLGLVQLEAFAGGWMLRCQRWVGSWKCHCLSGSPSQGAPRCAHNCDFTESTNTAPVLEGLHAYLLVAKACIFCNKRLTVHLFPKAICPANSAGSEDSWRHGGSGYHLRAHRCRCTDRQKWKGEVHALQHEHHL